MCAVVTCVQVINFVHVVVFVCVVIFVRVILLCDVQVYKACMDTYYQSDTSNDSIQVAHVLHSPPPPPANSFVLGPAVIKTHTLCESQKS